MDRRIGAITFAALLALSSPAGALPLGPSVAGPRADSGVAREFTAVHHKPGHYGGRGLHKGWYKKNRGKHKGWRR